MGQWVTLSLTKQIDKHEYSTNKRTVYFDLHSSLKCRMRAFTFYKTASPAASAARARRCVAALPVSATSLVLEKSDSSSSRSLGDESNSASLPWSKITGLV